MYLVCTSSWISLNDPHNFIKNEKIDLFRRFRMPTLRNFSLKLFVLLLVYGSVDLGSFNFISDK